MLEMRPGCECCDRDLAPDRAGAFICSFECTFCEACAHGVLNGICPNCSGALFARPTRAAAMLSRFPAATQRKVREKPCLERVATYRNRPEGPQRAQGLCLEHFPTLLAEAEWSENALVERTKHSHPTFAPSAEANVWSIGSTKPMFA